MAVVTDVRAYAVSDSEATLKWSDNGGASNDVYRSTNGSSYSEVSSNIALGVEIFEDSGLTADTKYWYKVTNDNGSTFSAVVTVYTHTCGANIGKLPDISSGDINMALENIQTQIAKHAFIGGDGSPADPDLCQACPSDGRLILRCYQDCDGFSIAISEDTTINSISLIGCGPCPPICISVAANVTLLMCGWPDLCPFDGDECFETPLSGGTAGRTFMSNGSSSPGVSAGAQDQLCPCEDETALNIICCPDSEDDDCNVTCVQNNVVLHFRACGGAPPYSWTLVDGGGGSVAAFIGSDVGQDVYVEWDGNDPTCSSSYNIEVEDNNSDTASFIILD